MLNFNVVSENVQCLVNSLSKQFLSQMTWPIYPPLNLPTICQSCGNQLTFTSVIWTISSAFQAKCHFNSTLKSWAHAAITAKISSWTWTTAITKHLSTLLKFKITNQTAITAKILESEVLFSWGNMGFTERLWQRIIRLNFSGNVTKTFGRGHCHSCQLLWGQKEQDFTCYHNNPKNIYRLIVT